MNLETQTSQETHKMHLIICTYIFLQQLDWMF